MIRGCFFISWWDVFWCVRGKLNVTRFPSNKSRDSSFSLAIREFSKFIFKFDFVDLTLAGMLLLGPTIGLGSIWTVPSIFCMGDSLFRGVPKETFSNLL